MRVTLHNFGYILIPIVIGASAAFFLVDRPQSKKLTPSAMDVCFAKSAMSYVAPDETCLKRTVNTLLQSYTTADLMNYIVASTSPKVVGSYCHHTAHVIGTETFIKSGDVETALSQCNRRCDYGCVHGVISAGIADDLGASYLNEDIVHANPIRIEELGTKYCYKRLNALCHAMGHILFIGSENIETALNGCKKIASEEALAREHCYQGVFMEASGDVAVFVKNPDTLANRKDNNYAYPCDKIGAEYQQACYFYLTNFQRQLFNKNQVSDDEKFGIIRKVCESVTEKKARSDCFLGIGRAFIDPDGSDESSHSPLLCDTLSGTDQDSCSVGLTIKLALHSRYADAFNYCSGRSSEKKVMLCYSAVFQTMESAGFLDDRIAAQCNASNAPDVCIQRYADYLPIAKTLPQYYIRGLFGDANL